MAERKPFYWLNEDSRTFLERGYLSEGETPEQRIKDIADKAEEILEIDGFADKFYDYMGKGFYSLSSPVWANFGKDRGMSISCVTGDTWVNTSTGGKQAKDIEIGDLVLTHKNRFKPVTKVIPTKDREDIWKLKVGTRMTNLYITGDHVVLTNTGWKRVDELDSEKDLIAVNGEVKYTPKEYVIDLEKIVHYPYEIKDGLIVANKRGYAKLPKKVNVDDDLAWAIGVWFADGSLTRDRNGNPNGIRITTGVDKECTTVKKWINIIQNKFNVHAAYYKTENERSSFVTVNANSATLGRFFEKFGNGSKNRLLNEELLNMPKKQLESLLLGLFEDGTYYEETTNYKLTLSNPKLILQVYNIGLKLGKDMSLQMQEKKAKMSTTAHVYTILFRKYKNSASRNNVRSGIKFSDGLIYCPIHLLEKTDKKEDVYDFTVEEDHSFSVAGVVVHNCFGSFIEDNLSSILDTASEVGMMSKFGGGTSGYFGNIRPRGSEITDNGQTSGSVHFMKLFEQMTDTVSQGCYDDKTEVLTENGFELLKDVVERKDGTLVAQVTDDDKIEFVEPLDYMEFIPDDKELIHFKDSKNIDLLVTKNHNMVFKYESKRVNKETGKNERVLRPEYRVRRADDMPLHRDVRLAHSSFAENGKGLTMKERLLIALQADGSIVLNCRNALTFRFAKKRKADRLEWILNSLNLKYTLSYYDKDDTYNFYVNVGEELPKTFEEWVDLTDVSIEWANDFVEEVSEWDGSYKSVGSYIYSSIIETNVDILQSIASMCGYKTYKKVDHREEYPNKSTIYNLYLSKGQLFGTTGVKTELIEYNGKVYCVEVPSHKLIVRRGGRVVVCGNSTRRGRFSPYLPIEHGDIDEFLDIGTEGNPIQSLTHGVSITDKWLEEMIAGDEEKKEVWAKLLSRRIQMGYPYIFFHDNANDNTVDVYKDKGLTINNSNLCSEIMLPNNEEWSFVCNLSSLNAERYDEWKDTDAVETMVYFLDAVMTEFIQNLEDLRDSNDPEDRNAFKHMERAYNFAKENRALGVGLLGLHSLYQSKMLPFESIEANKLNAEIFSTMKKRAYKASEELAERFGEPSVLKGYGRRNSTLLAIAPTTSSSFILGQVSKSIEPLMSNYFVVDTAKVKKTMINPYLLELLEEKGKNNEEVLNSIRDNDGSVQHLDFLTQREKDVFKTFGEINQYNVIEQAATRQQFIDQGQSLNIMVNPSHITAEELNELHLFAWANGIKSMYYQHGTNAAQQFNLSKICINCEA